MEYIETAKVRMDIARTKNPENASPLKENSNMEDNGKENKSVGVANNKYRLNRAKLTEPIAERI